MFTTRHVCSAHLGRPETLEAPPVGRRVACNQGTGRLWVVGRDGERWNGLPLEERWEAHEGCERLYRDPRQRAATDNVGLACGTKRLSTTIWSADISSSAGELDLVRIGQPLRPECAAWRYGDQHLRQPTIISTRPTERRAACDAHRGSTPS